MYYEKVGYERAVEQLLEVKHQCFLWFSGDRTETWLPRQFSSTQTDYCSEYFYWTCAKTIVERGTPTDRLNLATSTDMTLGNYLYYIWYLVFGSTS